MAHLGAARTIADISFSCVFAPSPKLQCLLMQCNQSTTGMLAARLAVTGRQMLFYTSSIGMITITLGSLAGELDALTPAGSQASSRRAAADSSSASQPPLSDASPKQTVTDSNPVPPDSSPADSYSADESLPHESVISQLKPESDSSMEAQQDEHNAHYKFWRNPVVLIATLGVVLLMAVQIKLIQNMPPAEQHAEHPADNDNEPEESERSFQTASQQQRSNSWQAASGSRQTASGGRRASGSGFGTGGRRSNAAGALPLCTSHQLMSPFYAQQSCIA